MLTSVPTLPSGLGRSRAFLKAVFLFLVSMAARPRLRTRIKTLRFACWKADAVRGRKLEIYHFLGQHGIDICLLTETCLTSGEAFRMTNYVCHRTDLLNEGGGKAILVRRGIDNYAVPFQDL
jgi:hypothetical protein